MSARHAEIAGGGIAGLSLATMLARAGWSVRVHERSPAIREAGAGIYMRNNSLEILDEYGVLDRLAALGTQIHQTQMRGAHGELRQTFHLTGPARTFVFPRQALVDVLADAARDAGVEITLDSEAVGTEPGGVLILANGTRLHADLIVAADGFRSRLRDAVIPGARQWELKTIVNRHFIAGRDLTPDEMSIQYWSGQRRVGVAPCGSHTYVYTNFPNTLPRAGTLPLDLADWGAAFPGLQRELAVIAAAPTTQYNYIMVDCPRWTAGRLAIIGDAAHGLPPTLGQGAGLSIMNARALTLALDRRGSIEDALHYWEQQVRFISDATQKWSCRYDSFTRDLPEMLRFLRPAAFWCFRHFPALNNRMRIADRGLALTALHP
jgi:2-polyprenyl-6-methoxyphenol hydroxylase-like FAD-dependent oxidoreductase